MRLRKAGYARPATPEFKHSIVADGDNAIEKAFLPALKGLSE